MFELVEAELLGSVELFLSLVPSILQLIASHAIETSDWFVSSSFVSVISSAINIPVLFLGSLTILIGPKINSNMSLHTVMLGSTINSINPKKKNIY